jgi:hypothetical protein
MAPLQGLTGSGAADGTPRCMGRSLARIGPIGLREQLRRSKVTTKDDGEPWYPAISSIETKWTRLVL